MQNNEKSNSGAIRKFFQEKGYYIVLFLCILAVGISGYIFISGAFSEKEAMKDETLSVATTTTVPSAKTERDPSKTDSASKSGSFDTGLPEDSVQTSTSTEDERVRAAAAAVRVAPVSGAELRAYSVDMLAYNSTTRDWRTHEGVDLTAALGEPVQAACAGTVSAVYEDEFLGTTVVISHPDGYATQYANLAATPTVSAGDSVSAGDVIGAVGETALLEIGEDPHLHFAVYLASEPVNPTEYLG